MNSGLGDVLACLDDLEGVVWEPYRHYGAGRPPRNPLGILKALVVKRVRNIQRDRQLYRRLWSDPGLRELCEIGSRTRMVSKKRFHLILESLRILPLISLEKGYEHVL